MSQSIILHTFLKIIFKLLFILFVMIIIAVLAFPIGFYGMTMYIEPTLPSVTEIKKAELEMPLQIYSHDQKLIGQFGNRLSLPVVYEDIPETMIQAFLAAEDSSFFEHSGISVKGLGRAITEVITDDSVQTGGSTITMQVAKNYFLTSERTFNRKITELFLARKIETQLSKNDIFTLYVNKIYMGEGAYGIRAGAKKYFSKSLEHLTIAETATLAGLPKAPSQNNPVKKPEQALIRRNWIIGRMLALGFITQEQHDEAVASPIGLNLYTEHLDAEMPYLAEMARYTLVNQFGDEAVNSGWRVRLTVDSAIQNQANNIVRKRLIAYDRRHGWRGAEANGEDLANFNTFNNMHPAKVTKVNSRSVEAELKWGQKITIPWSGLGWAKKYYNANRTGGYPGRASQIVKVDDIIRVTPSSADFENASWRMVQVPKVQSSLVSVEPNSGAVIALVGGFHYKHSKFNRATDGMRQPGSTIKPMIYAAALEKGFHPDSMVSDSPIRIGNWRPKNSDGRYYGAMPLRRGLYLSRNLVSIRLLRSVGATHALALIDQFGLNKDKLPTTLSLALGAGEASPLQMVTAYATFANGGHRIQPYFIDQIYGFDNQIIYQSNPDLACALCFNESLEKLNEKNAKINQKIDEEKQAEKAQAENTAELLDDSENTPEQDFSIDADAKNDRLQVYAPIYGRAEQAPRILSTRVSYEIADILKDVVQRGTATKARALGRSDIGGKTGTTNNFKDAWFAGFHPTNATVVWMGFDQPSTLGRKSYGGTLALPIWMEFMRHRLKNTPYQWIEDDNVADSEKQEKEVVDITNDGTVVKNKKKKVKEKKTNSKPTKTTTNKRKPKQPKSEDESSKTTAKDKDKKTTTKKEQSKKTDKTVSSKSKGDAQVKSDKKADSAKLAEKAADKATNQKTEKTNTKQKKSDQFIEVKEMPPMPDAN